MAKQHRRSFSVKPSIAVRLWRWARDTGESPTALLESALTDAMAKAGVPEYTRAEAIEIIERHAGRLKKARLVREVEGLRSAVFSF